MTDGHFEERDRLPLARNSLRTQLAIRILEQIGIQKLRIPEAAANYEDRSLAQDARRFNWFSRLENHSVRHAAEQQR